MRCKLCGKNSKDYKKIKNDAICIFCFDSLPNVIKNHPKEYTIDNLKNIKKIIYKSHSATFSKCGSMYLCEEAIQLCDWEIKISNIKSIEINFHPRAYGSGRYVAKGDLSAIIHTVSPHLKIEEIFLEDIALSYRIAGKEIKYIYPSQLLVIFKQIQDCINNRSYNLRHVKEAMKNKTNDQKKKKETEFDKAKSLYGLEIPYTIDQLKSIRNRLIKENHPDEGGNAEKCAEINDAYELLEKFAINI